MYHLLHISSYQNWEKVSWLVSESKWSHTIDFVASAIKYIEI